MSSDKRACMVFWSNSTPVPIPIPNLLALHAQAARLGPGGEASLQPGRANRGLMSVSKGHGPIFHSNCSKVIAYHCFFGREGLIRVRLKVISCLLVKVRCAKKRAASVTPA